jgi:co-chaperonin GroES (HSP10)
VTQPATDIDKLAAKQKERLESKEEAKHASQLPDPVGYKLLIALPERKDVTEGGIALAEETIRREEVGAVCGLVLKIGPDAYMDKAKFPTGPWCKVGQWVLMRSYSGTRIKVRGKEFRLLNDDSIDGVVEDPAGIVKV